MTQGYTAQDTVSVLIYIVYSLVLGSTAHGVQCTGVLSHIYIQALVCSHVQVDGTIHAHPTFHDPAGTTNK